MHQCLAPRDIVVLVVCGGGEASRAWSETRLPAIHWADFEFTMNWTFRRTVVDEKILQPAMIFNLNFLTILLILPSTWAQDYSDYGNDYAQDSIYYDYANKQVEKQAGRGAGWVKIQFDYSQSPALQQNSLLLTLAL